MNHPSIGYRSQPPLKGRIKKNALFQARVTPTVLAFVFLLFSIVFSLRVLLSAQEPEKAVAAISVVTEVAGVKRTLPKGIVLSQPKDLLLRGIVFTQDRLYHGKLLLIDEKHPIPLAAAAPNTLSISAHAGGQVATRSAQTLTDRETLQALKELFQAGRQKGIGNWTVFAGTRSNEQQLDLQLEQLKVFAQSHSLEEAASMAARTWESPGCSEHQTGFAVDIRLCDDWNAPARTQSLSESREGQYLLDEAWRYGFIHRYQSKNPHRMPEEAYHFRYVGKPAAELMHLLEMTLEEFLSFAREKKEWAYYEDGKLKYYVVCEKAPGDWLTQAPDGVATIDYSADNTGYAIAIYGF